MTERESTETWLSALVEPNNRRSRLTHTRRLAARGAQFDNWPAWADPNVVAAYQALGIARPWRHQVAAADAVWAGENVSLATSTGSGKSLAFWLPALTAILASQGHDAPTVLYLAPTKALAADQQASLQRLVQALPTAATGPPTPSVLVATCDGDTGAADRKWIQDYANIVLTNPDFLHFAMLPGHRRWARFLRNLRYVIVDEGHSYRGVFGAHVSLILRRLARLVVHYRSRWDPRASGTDAEGGASGPVFVVASGTSAEPGTSAARLLGVDVGDVTTVSDDASPAGERTVALWQPPEIPSWAAANGGGAGRATGVPSDDGAGRVDWGTDPFSLANPFEVLERVGEAGPDRVADVFAGLDPLGVANPFEEASPFRVASPFEEAGPDRAGANGAPRSATEGSPTAPARRTATAEMADLLADLTAAGARSLAFTRSRRGAETVAAAAREHLRDRAPDRVDQIAAYRGGYLPEERRRLEAALRAGTLRALATTNALELGVDISGLDTVFIAGWPGTLMSWWQQAGRAGRAGADGLVVFIAREDPLDNYLVTHPEALLDTPIEATVFDPGNPYVLAGQLCAAAQELPLRTADLPRFGAPERVRAVLAELVDGDVLRRRNSGWYWTRHGSAAELNDLRGASGAPVRVVDAASGRILGTVDAGSADGQVHAGAVYVHQGETFVITALDLADHVALAQARVVDHGTWSREVLTLEILSPGWDRGERDDAGLGYEPEPRDDAGPDDQPGQDDRGGLLAPVDLRTRNWGPIRWGFGQIEVTSRVVSFERRRLPDFQVLSTEALDLPERRLLTTGVWWCVPPEVLAAAGIDPGDVPGALHAAEHASIGLLPLLATCDRWDLGGLSTDCHADTGAATVFVYDAYPGGAGFAERGYELGETWLAATLAVIEGCACDAGCPSCIQSPKCGTNNSPLDKGAAIQLLRVVLRHAPQGPTVGRADTVVGVRESP